MRYISVGVGGAWSCLRTTPFQESRTRLTDFHTAEQRVHNGNCSSTEFTDQQEAAAASVSPHFTSHRKKRKEEKGVKLESGGGGRKMEEEQRGLKVYPSHNIMT